jgi:hypothetical protein
MRKFLYVSPSGSSWKVHWQHEFSGPLFRRKKEALTEARRMIASLKKGMLSSIKIRKANGKFQAEWTYGRDPYPPKG